ncbi:MAG: hypothetical protein M0T70_17455 [Geobacteraceae bacterium]|nr:hypothetical protein [Geobacteraceae bacterium]
MNDQPHHLHQTLRLPQPRPGATWTDATKRKVPYKPLLSLAVLDLVHRGVITSRS